MKIGEKEKKVDEVEEEEEEVEVKTEKKTEKKTVVLDSDDRKKIVRLLLIIMGVMCLFLFILFLASLTSTRTYTYAEVEDIMKKAAESYFTDHPESLPQSEGSGVEIDSSNLIAAEKMKPISDYLGEEANCTGSVKVEKINSQYLYIPALSCGDLYATTKLYEKILSQETVSSGYGLYAVNGSYIYRGENVNNYVQLDKSLWRIVKVNSNHTIVLIHAEGITYSQPWDDRYNDNKLYESGFNQYSASRVKEYLEKVYVKPSEDDGEDILSNSDKAKMIPYTLCVGKRSETSEKKNNFEECTSTLKSQKLGLLTLSDYLYASTDPNCKSASTKTCKNYNYLTLKSDWWLVTGNKDDDYSVFCVNRSGHVQLETASNYALVRPVIYFNSGVLYKDGDGSQEKPFQVR